MAFICERIPEERKHGLNPDSYLKRGQTTDLWKWAIDRERDAHLISLGSFGPDADNLFGFTLTWHGKVIHFLGSKVTTGDETKGIDLAWEVHDIRIPDELQQDRGPVLRMMEEALGAYGLYGNRSVVKSLKVKFREAE